MVCGFACRKKVVALAIAVVLAGIPYFWRSRASCLYPSFPAACELTKNRCRQETGHSHWFQASRTGESGTDKRRRLPRRVRGFRCTRKECSVRRGQRSGTAECGWGSCWNEHKETSPG